MKDGSGRCQVFFVSVVGDGLLEFRGGRGGKLEGGRSTFLGEVCG